MPGGEWFGTAFFFLLFVAAVTSSISMLEVTVSWATERFGGTRARTAVGCAFVSWLIGLPALLSFNVWSGVHPLGFLPVFATKTFFDLFDYFAANILLPAGGLCMAIFAGWVLSENVFWGELGGGRWPRVCRWLLRYLTPVALAVIFFYLILG
jgi:NSS family neurotransmitter:Na+ symporter